MSEAGAGPAPRPTFDSVVAEHGAAIARIAAAFEANAARRDELGQEILLAIWQSLPRFRGRRRTMRARRSPRCCNPAVCSGPLRGSGRSGCTSSRAGSRLACSA